jgi:aminoglycoside phosphotransferase (APT) family kinase protein
MARPARVDEHRLAHIRRVLESAKIASLKREEVRAALSQSGVMATDMVQIRGGEANWTFLVDDNLIVRFPRTEEVAQATAREIALLPRLSRHVSFPVPLPTVIATWNNFPFFGYQRIVGSELRRADLSDKLLTQFGAQLAQLNSFPLDQVPLRSVERSIQTAWHDRYVHLWPQIEEFVLPELHSVLSDLVRQRFWEMLDQPPAFPFCFVHNDLGLEHVLIDSTGDSIGGVIGMIDFEDAAIGDPAVDLAPISAMITTEQLRYLVGQRDLGERLPERIQFYRWMGSVHAILYGIQESDDAERISGIRGLQQRLEGP